MKRITILGHLILLGGLLVLVGCTDQDATSVAQVETSADGSAVPVGVAPESTFVSLKVPNMH